MKKKIITLFNHFTIANSIKHSICNVKYSEKEKKEKYFELAKMQDSINRMQVFYALEYVLIEKYKLSNFKNKKIDDLLDENKIEKLRKFRNAMFHIQNNPINEKILGFLEEKESEIWIKNIHNAFEKFFIEELKIKKVIELFRK